MLNLTEMVDDHFRHDAPLARNSGRGDGGEGLSFADCQSIMQSSVERRAKKARALWHALRKDQAYWRIPVIVPFKVQPLDPELLLGAANFIVTIPGLMFIS